jgi:hypothetical protein
MRAPISAQPLDTPLAPPPVERSRPIPILAAEPSAPVAPPQPAGYAAPFSSAEMPQGDSPEATDLLPEFAPPRNVTPEELAASLWMDEAPEPSPPPKPRVQAPQPPPVLEAEAPQAVEMRTPARDQIAEAALDTLSERFPRVMLLVAGQDAVQGWSGRGSGLSREPIARLRIAWGEPSVFAFVKLAGTAHRGSVSRALIPAPLAEILGTRVGVPCAVFPVRIKDRLVSFLYADRLGAPMSDEDYRALEIASSSLGSALARLLLELRKAVPAE